MVTACKDEIWVENRHNGNSEIRWLHQLFEHCCHKNLYKEQVSFHLLKRKERWERGERQGVSFAAEQHRFRESLNIKVGPGLEIREERRGRYETHKHWSLYQESLVRKVKRQGVCETKGKWSKKNERFFFYFTERSMNLTVLLRRLSPDSMIGSLYRLQ